MKKGLSNRKNRIMQVIAMILALTMFSMFVLNAVAESGVEFPAVEEPAAAEEVIEETPAEETVGEEPATEEVVEEAPEAAAPVVEEVIEETPAEETVEEEPATEEVVEEVSAEEPVVETPAVNNEEPLADESENDNITLAGDIAPRGVDIYLYANPDVNAKKLRQLSPNDDVIVLQHVGRWVEVNYQGLVGYIPTFKVDAEVKASETVNTADVKEEGEVLADEEVVVEDSEVEVEEEALEAEESAAEGSDVAEEGEAPADEEAVEEAPVAEEPAAEDTEVSDVEEGEVLVDEEAAVEDSEVEAEVLEDEEAVVEDSEVEAEEAEALADEEGEVAEAPADGEPAAEEANAEESTQSETPAEENPEELSTQEEEIDIQEILDRYFADRSIHITYHLNGKEGITFGDDIYFTAILSGYESPEYSLDYYINWQYNVGGSDWSDIPGAVSENYVLTIDQNNQNWNVRALVTITGVSVVEP
ncbi:MAG: SH3 domain-containing protein [Christensenellaceae bacterium]|nr:SH3 domain-containing protein [Christensenellaceae bacterium]